jgi:hypothetical protein
MQRATIVRYTAKPGRAEENEALARAVFTELRGKPAQALAYALLRNGDDFLHLFLNLAADDADGVVGLESFKAFAASGAERWTAPPDLARHTMRLVDAYGFGTATTPA